MSETGNDHNVPKAVPIEDLQRQKVAQETAQLELELQRRKDETKRERQRQCICQRPKCAR